MKNNAPKSFFYGLPKNFTGIFWGKKLLWAALAATLTFACAASGFDWLYHTSSRTATLQSLAWPAVWLGFCIPIFAPAVALAWGAATKNSRTTNTGFALAQSAAVGWLVSAVYKFFTGRVAPANATRATSDTFKFGLGRGGVFNGWPSSHTTVAFAMAVALLTLYPKNRAVGYAALAYAAYIGLGVSVTIHWFSDFMAGIIFGSVVGYTIGKSFLARYRKTRLA